jgi:hypothetical protein
MDDSDLIASLLGRPLDRRTLLRGAVAATAGGTALYTLGCGSSPSATKTPAPSGTAAATGEFTPSLLTAEFVARQDNRFAVGLVNKQKKLVKNAVVHLKFFKIGADGSGTLRGEGDADFVELDVAGARPPGATPTAGAPDDSVAFYIASTPFDVSGDWGVEIAVTPRDGSAPAKIQAPFKVLDQSVTPPIGTLPPASKNEIAATPADAARLCSRVPACPLHDKVIGDLLGKGRPLVVQFSTPAFCQTRFCGPVLEVLLGQVPAYQDRVDFVHIEVWQDFQLQQIRSTVKEWNLPGEPYTFFMGRDGSVRAKLEAIFSNDELTAALKLLV